MIYMYNELSKRGIDRSALKENDYLSSLLDASLSASVISKATVIRVKTDCLALLASRAELFTCHKSSSVPVETAQVLMDSIVHTIGVYLKTFPSPDDAALYLENGKYPVYRAYCLGLKLIENKFRESKKRYIRLKKHLLKTPNEFYTSTLSSGITAFFRNYSAEYTSHIIGITADYRPLLPIPELSGMEFMEKYIKYLYIENAFLDSIGYETVHRAMYAYDTSYATELVNIFETVLFAAFVPVSCGKSIGSLKAVKADRTSLCKKLESLDENGLEEYVTGLLHIICEEIDADDAMISYTLQCVPVICAKIRAYARRGMTEALFTLKPPVVESTSYIDGEQMTDDDYDKLVSEVMQCDSSEKKIAFIFGSVRSVADLADVIRDAYLDENEIKEIKSRLSSEETELLEKYI